MIYPLTYCESPEAKLLIVNYDGKTGMVCADDDVDSKAQEIVNSFEASAFGVRAYVANKLILFRLRQFAVMGKLDRASMLVVLKDDSTYAIDRNGFLKKRD